MHKQRSNTQKKSTQVGTPQLGQFLRDLAGFQYRVPRRLLTQWRGERGGKVMQQFLRTPAQSRSVAERQAEALQQRREHAKAVAARRASLA